MINTLMNLEHIHLPTISVVITTYRRPNSLLRVLDCLRDQAHTDLRDLDCVILNDGSHDAGYRYDYNSLYPFEITYVPKPRAEDDTPRLYSLKNLGVHMTTHEVVWLLDDDLYFDDHTLEILRIWHALLAHARPVLVPHYADNKELPESAEYYQAPFSFNPQPIDWDKLQVWTSFAGLSFWRKDFNAIGGIDEAYDGSMGSADLDLGIRFWQSGCQVIQVDGICCFIEDSETGSHRSEIIYRQLDTDPHRNGRYFIEKWGPEEAQKYNCQWDANDERKYGIHWNPETRVFERW